MRLSHLIVRLTTQATHVHLVVTSLLPKKQVACASRIFSERAGRSRNLMSTTILSYQGTSSLAGQASFGRLISARFRSCMGEILAVFAPVQAGMQPVRRAGEFLNVMNSPIVRLQNVTDFDERCFTPHPRWWCCECLM